MATHQPPVYTIKTEGLIVFGRAMHHSLGVIFKATVTIIIMCVWRAYISKLTLVQSGMSVFM